MLSKHLQQTKKDHTSSKLSNILRGLHVFVGPSGCGKSTLLDLLAGFTKPDEGLISVSDEVVRKPGPERGFVFQKNSLIPWQTLEQNVGYGLKLQKVNSKDIEEKVTKYLKLGFGKISKSLSKSIIWWYTAKGKHHKSINNKK